ncbi:MAG: alpha/beta fold hydrolase [Chloroflexota bacterium]|nr:alpha/beta fold hydrolase [Chloroflexota bacterium]MDE2941093.1 alpha/beta fold hydrolase [Chloroflexota bacterium]MDE3267381.1 alpha/beta fold hydrolase [Chloroflexota bacterium]
MMTGSFLLWLLPAKRIGIPALALVLALLASGCSAHPGPGGGAEKVEFGTEDGVQLSGHVFGSGSVGVVLSHMRPTDQESWWPFARVLKDKGFQALTFDFRGYRDSQGEVDIGSIDTDVEAALDYLKDRGASRVFLVGASMGGTASLKVAARSEVAGVVTLSAPPSIDGVDATPDLRRIAAPKLFIAARDDGFYARSASLFEQRTDDPRERHLVEGAAHGTDMLSGDSGPRAQGLILDFLRRYSE